MPAGCRAVKQPDDIEMLAKSLQSSEMIDRLLNRFPIVGGFVRAVNASADLGDDVRRTTAAMFALREERDVAVQVAMANHFTNHKPLRELLDNFDPKTGFADFKAKSTGRTIKTHWHDALEGSIKRWDLTPEQRDAMTDLKAVWEDIRFDYNRFGGTLSEDGNMFPRVVDGWYDDAGKLVKGDVQLRGGGKMRVGGAFTKSRAVNDIGEFKNTSEMVNDGKWHYMDAEEALSTRAREVSQRTADLQLQDYLKKQPFFIKGRKPTARHPGRAPAEDFGGTKGETIEIKPFTSETVPAMAGYEGPRDIVQYIEDVLGRPEKVNVPVLGQLMDESRATVASFDLGTIGIQLMGALAADFGHLLPRVAGGKLRWSPSAIFPKAVLKSLPALASKDYRVKYLAANRDVIERWAAQLGGMNTSEYLDALRTDTKFLPYKLIHKLENPTARFFGTSLDVAKIEYIKSLEALYGKDLSMVDKERLGAWVRNSLGQTSTARLGMSPRQQSIESTFFLFSPRYTRSLVATIGTLRHMDKAGAEAWASLGGMATAGITAYIGFAAALGQEPQLDPRKPGFLSLRFGDNYIGIGGGIKAISSLVVKTTTDPMSLTDVDFQSNPILKFWKNRTSPLTGTAMDVMTGKDALGVQIDDGNDYLRAGMNRIFPFAAQAAAEANGGIDQKSLALIANGLGASANPMAAWDVYDKYLKDQRKVDGTQRFPDGYQTVNSKTNGFFEFTHNDPTALALKANWEDQRVSRGGDSEQTVKIQRERHDRLTAADNMLAQTGNYYQYRQQANSIRALSREEFRALSLNSPRTTTADKKVVNAWYDTYNDPSVLDPITGGLNSDALETLQNQWKADNPGKYESLIEPNETLGETKNETMLRTDRKTIAAAGWWDTDKQAWETVSSKAGKYTFGAKNIAEYKAKKQQEWTQKAAAAGNPEPGIYAERQMARDPIARMFTKLRTMHRLVVQRENPEIISLLSKWGYNSTSLQEYRFALQSQAQQGQ